MRKWLWVGDAACGSGFARATHEILDVARKTAEVHVLGLNYLGDPHPYPYDIYPCFSGGDMFGVGRLEALVRKLAPDVIVIQNDPWNIPAYIKQLKEFTGRTVGMIAVDGKNCAGEGLNDLDLAIFWTQFGLMEARRGGHTGLGAIVPLGVDTTVFSPGSKSDARVALGLPEHVQNAFIVGNINRNQLRKRLDLTIEYFAEWVHTKKISDAYLFLHVCPTGDSDGYDVRQLMKFYGMQGRLIVSEPPPYGGAEESQLALAYRAFDIQVSTTQGEGWGLTTAEGMACGIPQIVPDWSALGEWAKPAAILVPCGMTAATPGTINVLGGLPDKAKFIEEMDSLYRNEDRRDYYSAAGRKLVSEPQFRWPGVGQMFVGVIDDLFKLQKHQPSASPLHLVSTT